MMSTNVGDQADQPIHNAAVDILTTPEIDRTPTLPSALRAAFSNYRRGE